MPPARRLAFAAGLSAARPLERVLQPLPRVGAPPRARRLVQQLALDELVERHLEVASVYTIPHRRRRRRERQLGQHALQPSTPTCTLARRHQRVEVRPLLDHLLEVARERAAKSPPLMRRPPDQPEPMTVEEPAEPPLEDHIMSRRWL